jgi:hypothetical protein
VSSSFIDRPRRLLLFALLVITMIVGIRIVIHVTTSGPPGNDPATLAQLRSQFAGAPWEPDLIAAFWARSGDLHVTFDRDDRPLALQACADLIEAVQQERAQEQVDIGDRSLFIFDRSDEVLVSNFSSLSTGCRWRRG